MLVPVLVGVLLLVLAAVPELAALSRRRNEAAASLIENTEGSLRSRWRLGLSVFLVALGLASIVMAMFTDEVAGLVQGVALMLVGWCTSPSVQKKSNERMLARLRRANDADADTGVEAGSR